MEKNSKYQYWICRLCWKINNIPGFNTFILILIILNTLILATDKYPNPGIDIIGKTNVYFTTFFTLECIIKIVGMNYRDWKVDAFNIFDLIIVISSLVEISISTSSKGIISALRAFRLLRLIKLARSNHTLRCLLDSMAHTVKAIGNFAVILCIFIYVFSLLGMEMFAGKFRFDPNDNFDWNNGKVPR